MKQFGSRMRVLAGMILCMSLTVAAQDAGRESTVRIDTSLVLVDGIVLDKKTHAIIGDLKQQDFTIKENGNVRAITHFSREELPLSVVLLVDVSGSVQPIIEEIRKAALDALGRLKPTDRVATMVFANRSKVVTPLTTDHHAVADRLDYLWRESLEVGYGTMISMGIYDAARYLSIYTSPTDRRAIVLITDDEDFRYAVPPREVVLKELYDNGAAVCGIVVGRGKGMRTAMTVGTTAAVTAVNPVLGGIMIGMKVLRIATTPISTTRYFAEQTGGITLGARHEEIGTVFIGLMQLLRMRYTFGFEPAETADDGKLREIKLTVNESARKQRGELQVLARRGYYLRPQNSPGFASAIVPPTVMAAVSPAVAPAMTVGRPVAREYPADVPGTELAPVPPVLDQVARATLGPSYSCRPKETGSEKGYLGSALFLSEYSRRRNLPELVFDGACGTEDNFISATVGGDLSLIADLGDVAIESVTSQSAFNLQGIDAFAHYSKFAQSVKVGFNHTYAAVLNGRERRGLLIFKVIGYLPNERVDLKYVVKEYQFVEVKSASTPENRQ